MITCGLALDLKGSRPVDMSALDLAVLLIWTSLCAMQLLPAVEQRIHPSAPWFLCSCVLSIACPLCGSFPVVCPK